MLRFELGPSRTLTGILILVHGISIYLIGYFLHPWWVAVSLMILVLASGIRSVRIHGLKNHPSSIRALWAKEEGLWEIITAGGISYEAQLQAGSYVSPSLTVLNFRVPGRFQSINGVILPEGIEAEAFRQLRVWLKWGRPLQKEEPDTDTGIFDH